MIALALCLFAAPVVPVVDDWPTVEVRLLGEAVVEVGEPFEVELVCRHGASFEIEASAQVEENLTLDDGWLVLDRRAIPDVPAPGAPILRHGFAPDVELRSRVVYTIASLRLEARDGESGLFWNEQRALTGLGLDVVRNGERRFVAAPPLEVRVTSLLAPTDRTPRPLPAPIEAPGAADKSRTRLLLAGGAAAALALIAFAVVKQRRTRRAPVAAPPPTRRETLIDLQSALSAGRAPLRDSVFELVAAVRASCAERGAPNLPSDTDEEWRARIDAALFARGELDRLDRFLRLAENARFSPATPTRWAVLDLAQEAVAIEDETLQRAQSVAAAGRRR